MLDLRSKPPNPPPSYLSPPMPGILLAFGYTALLLYLMRKLPFFAQVPGLTLRTQAVLFLLKVAAGTALWAVYTYVYTDRATADVYKYFDDGMVMFSALPDKPGDYLRMLFGFRNDSPYFSEQYYQVMNNWYRQYESNMYNDAHTVIRFNAFVRLFSFGEIHVHTVFAAMASFTGTVALYRTFVRLLPGRERLLMAVLFLLPSVLFWASGAIKESLLFFGLGLLVWQVFRLMDGRFRASGIPVVLFAMVLLFFLKFYVLLSMLPALAALWWARRSTRVVLPFVVVYTAFVLLGLHAERIIPGFDILAVLAIKQKDFIGLATGIGAGSFVMPTPLEPNFMSFLSQAPYALYITLVGPLVHAAGGALGMLAAAENVAYLLLVALCLLYRRPLSSVDGRLLLALLCYGLVLSLVIGWTTPVMGAIVRYRTPLMPFLLTAALMLLDERKLLERWPFLRRTLSA